MDKKEDSDSGGSRRTIAAWAFPLSVGTLLWFLRAKIGIPGYSWIGSFVALHSGESTGSWVAQSPSFALGAGWLALFGVLISFWAHALKPDEFDSLLIVPWMVAVLALPLFLVTLTPLVWLFNRVTWLSLGVLGIASLCSIVFFCGTARSGCRPKQQGVLEATKRFSYGAIFAFIIEIANFFIYGAS